PKPQGDARLPSTLMSPRGSHPSSEPGEGDDFAGVRTYVPGESQRHIDWKAVARGQPLMTKQFAAEAEGVVNLDFSNLVSTNVEEKLSQLALWVVEAERAQRLYSLGLPAVEIPAGIGQLHFHRCLRALSLFDSTNDLLKRAQA